MRTGVSGDVAETVGATRVTCGVATVTDKLLIRPAVTACMRRVHTLPLVIAMITLLVAVGGVAAATAVDDPAAVNGPAAIDDPATATLVGPDDPTTATEAECESGAGTDLIGCWDGVHYSEDPGFDQADGLTDEELERLTHLTMARIEHLRERPFQSAVPVDTVSRSEFANDSAVTADGDEAFQRWNDQVWKALFVVGEDDASSDAIDAVFGGSVGGFYSPAENRIVLVVGDDTDLQVSELTLAHELGHAMQDQYENLGDTRFLGATQDADLAIDGIVEGEVVYLEELYDARCADDWTCLDEPTDDDGGELPPAFNFGILQTVLQPYSDGVFYVEERVEADGWDAVDTLMAEPPSTTSEVIHRNPDYETRDIDFADTSTDDWALYPDQGVDGAETAGEASMFVMFWYQSYEYGHAVLDPDATPTENVQIHTDTDADLRTRVSYNYAHPATDGWAGDELYPYRNATDTAENDDGTADGDDDTAARDDGYVWVTEWQTEADADQFHETYLRMLTAHGEEPYEAGEVYSIDDGDFRGAYGVEQNETTVTITHAPEPEAVLELRPDAALSLPAETADDTDGIDDTSPPTQTDSTDITADDSDTDADDVTGGEAPGFGVAVALVSVLAGALLARRVSH